MTAQKPKPYIHIIGGGLPGWSAAAVLADQLSAVADIQINASGDDDAAANADYGHIILDSESVLLLHSGMTAGELVSGGQGGFSLGSCFERWGPNGRPVYHAPGEPLPAPDGVAVHQILRRLSVQQGNDALFADLYLPLAFQARMAATGKFSPPSEDRQSPRSLLRPAITVDGSILTDIMRDKAMTSGVQLSGGNGEGALLIIDCRPIMGPKDIDCGAALGFDRCVTARFRGRGPHPPYDIVRPLDHGQMSILPLQDGAIVNVYYPAALWDTDAAEEAARGAISGAVPGAHDPADCAIIANRAIWPGYMERPWQGNIVHIGPGAAELGSVMGAAAKLLSHQLATLVSLLPRNAEDDMAIKAAEYNRKAAAFFGHMRDFHQLALVRSNMQGDYWNQMKQQPMSPNLQRRVRQFERRGLLVLIDDDPFEKHNWLEMLIGLGIVPAIYDHAADGIDMDKKMRALGAMVMAFDQTIAAMPTHGDFLNQMAHRMT
ncbi:tryptophan 7-halogenase [Sphingorhabdus arenilitoris]|uniref:Tryptophan 7-halogenase n=1 Tax=Sphingorhabdus arenilitoris TaxID=1490041 RepID=A0ABV8RIP5_9SPHN